VSEKVSGVLTPHPKQNSMGGTRIFELGAARGQGGGHRGQKKIVVIGLSTEEN